MLPAVASGPQQDDRGSVLKKTKLPDTRLALVIGNGQYADSPLANPVSDAKAMAQKLKKLGFTLQGDGPLLNANRQAMTEAVRAFGSRLRSSGGVGLFYFAGHGLQVEGHNYLVPIGADIAKESDVEFECYPAEKVLAEMGSSSDRLNIVILDACRNNPFSRDFGQQGLSPMAKAAGALIAYAAAPGKTASDNAGAQNGLYTEELLKLIDTPGLSIEDVFKRTRQAVMARSNGKQTPWEESALVNDFSFVGGTRPIESKPVAKKAPSDDWISVGDAFLAASKDDTNLKKIPQGDSGALLSRSAHNDARTVGYFFDDKLSRVEAKNFEFEADVLYLSFSDAKQYPALCLEARRAEGDGADTLSVDIGASGDRAGFGVWEKIAGNWKVLAEAQQPRKFQEKFHLKVLCYDTSLSVWVDGQRVIQTSVSRVSSGAIGIGLQGDGSGVVSQVSIKSLD